MCEQALKNWYFQLLCLSSTVKKHCAKELASLIVMLLRKMLAENFLFIPISGWPGSYSVSVVLAKMIMKMAASE